METITHVEDNQNNIFPKAKEGSERDVELNIERREWLWDSFHLSLDIATLILRIYLEKPTWNSKPRSLSQLALYKKPWQITAATETAVISRVPISVESAQSRRPGESQYLGERLIFCSPAGLDLRNYPLTTTRQLWILVQAKIALGRSNPSTEIRRKCHWGHWRDFPLRTILVP